MASPPPAAHGFGVDPRQLPAVTHCTPGPYPPDLSQALVTRLQPLIHFRYATGLASRTRTAWQYRHVPALSGLLPALTSVPQIKLPPASIRPLRRPKRKGLSPLSTIQRLVAHTAHKYSNAVGRERLRQAATERVTCPNDRERPRTTSAPGVRIEGIAACRISVQAALILAECGAAIPAGRVVGRPVPRPWPATASG